MLLVVSDSVGFCKNLHSQLLSRGLFSLFATYENMADIVESETDLIDTVIIDGCHSSKGVRAVQERSISRLPHADIRLLTVDSQLNDLVASLSVGRDEYASFRGLRVSPSDTEARLLGYPLRLTKSEHKILLLLLSDPGRPFSADLILRVAFPFSTDLSKNQLAVHICNINKKARQITGRRLIVNPHKSGYLLNPHP